MQVTGSTSSASALRDGRERESVTSGRGQEMRWACGVIGRAAEYNYICIIFSENGTYVKDGFTSFLPGIPGALEGRRCDKGCRES